MRFAEAKNLLAEEKKHNPSNLITVYLDHYIDFLTVFNNEEAVAFNQLKKNKDQRINLLESGNQESPYYRYCLCEINLQTALIRIKNEEYLTAAREINRAYRLLEENQRLFPGFLPNLKSLGIMHCLIGAIPDQYQWVTRILNFQGTQRQGIAELKQVIEKSASHNEYGYLRPETIFMLTWIEVNIESSKSEIKILKDLLQQEDIRPFLKSSPLFAYTYAFMLIKSGENDEAVKTLLNAPEGPAYFQMSFMYYQTGQALLNRVDTAAAKYYRFYLYRFKGRNYIKTAWQKLAWISLLKGQHQQYQEYMQKALKTGYAFTDSDKQAVKEAKSGVSPNLRLLKARLLFDGGYYKKAEEALKEPSVIYRYAGLRDSVEYYYRLGRISQELGRFDEAVQLYLITMSKGKEQTWYFSSNAALLLGQLYENRGEKEKARQYYKQSLSMKCDEYRNSIHFKAKAGLKRLGTI